MSSEAIYYASRWSCAHHCVPNANKGGAAVPWQGCPLTIAPPTRPAVPAHFRPMVAKWPNLSLIMTLSNDPTSIIESEHGSQGLILYISAIQERNDHIM